MKVYKDYFENRGFDLFILKKYFVLNCQILNDTNFYQIGRLYNSNLTLVNENIFEIGWRGFYFNDDFFLGYDFYKKKINVINIKNWELENSYDFPQNSELNFILSENFAFLYDGKNHYKFNFITNNILWKIEGDISLRFAKNNKYFIFQHMKSRSSISCLNIELGHKQWEINFKDKNALLNQKRKDEILEKIESLDDLDISQFEIFWDKIIVRLRSHVLLCISIGTGQIEWLNHDDGYPKDYSMYSFEIDKETEKIYVIGFTGDRSLQTFDINTGLKTWKSDNNFALQSEVCIADNAEFTMNEKYIFLGCMGTGEIIIIEKATGLVIDKTRIFKRKKTIYGVLTKPVIFQNKLLILVVGELFVYDISEYV